MRKLSELRNSEIDPTLSPKYARNKMIMNAIAEINEKNEMLDLVENSHNNAVKSNNKLNMFSNDYIKPTKAKLMEQELIEGQKLTEQNLVSVLSIILETAVPTKNHEGLDFGKISNQLIENLGMNFFLNAKSNTFRTIIEAAKDPEALEDASEDINSVAKILQTKVKEAINQEKENVISMQEKTNEMIETNKYKDPEKVEAETDPVVDDEQATDETTETPETDEKDNSGLDDSMGEYDKSVKESGTFDYFMNNLLNEAKVDDLEDEVCEECGNEECTCGNEEDTDDEYDENFADVNDALLDDLSIDELDTELDKLMLDEDMYDTDDLSDEDLAEIGMEDDEYEELEESSRFVSDSKFNLIADDKFKTKKIERKTLIESLIISLAPKYLNEAEGTAMNEGSLINEAILAYTILEMFNTFKLVDFSNGKIDTLKNNILK